MTRTGKKKKSASGANDTTEQRRDAVLMAALPDVAFDGWTQELLDRAADACGENPAVLFDNGVAGLVSHFSDWADREMLAACATPAFEKLRVRDRIRFGVEARTAALAPWKEAAQAALKFMSAPPRALRLPKMVWRTADRLWRAAGDTATDYNHYTKRILLSAVLGSSGVFWLGDDSEDHTRTKDFIQARIDNVMAIGKKIGGFKSRFAQNGKTS